MHPVSPLFNLWCLCFTGAAATAIFTLSLHDALPIFNGIVILLPRILRHGESGHIVNTASMSGLVPHPGATLYGTSKDRKSTRLNSSHTVISYAVFCLKKKKVAESVTGVAAIPVSVAQ